MGYTLITGATSGIGLEYARIAAQNGRDLIIVGRDNPKLLEVKAEINKLAPSIKVITFNQDLTLIDSAKNIFEFTQKENLNVDCLINNAGFGNYKAFSESDIGKQTGMIQVNITTLTELSRYFLPQMIQMKNGHILNMSSVAAFLPGPMMSVYYATKAYVLHFSQAISEELKGTGVYVTAVCPGPTDSHFDETAGNVRDDFFAKIRRLPTSREVAEFGYNSMLKNKRVAIYGLGNNLYVFLLRFIPTSLVTNWVYTFQNTIH